MLDAALIYAGEGFSVIPLHFLNYKGGCTCGKSDCASPGKHPLTRHGLRDASNDPDQITKWWTQFPRANIGVVTGSSSGGLVVIDFDPRHGGTAVGLNLPGSLKVITGNGWHLWFRSSQSVRNSAGKLGPGIDVRGNGGYVVAPPSKHVSGSTYTFDNKLDIADLPDDFFDQFEPVPAAPTTPDLIISDPGIIESEAIEGSRNDYLASLGGGLRRKGYSNEEIEALLLVANRKRCKPPLADKEVGQIAWSVGRYTPVDTLDINVVEPVKAVPPPPVVDPDPDADYDPFSWDDTEPLLGAITAEQLGMTVFGEPEMIIQGLFRGDWGLMIGIGSVGKTTFMHNVCISLAAGRPFIPIIPAGQKPRRILYLDFESNPWRLQKQVGLLRDWLTPGENDLVDKNLHFAIEPQTAGGPWRMTDKQSLLNVAKYIQEQKIDLLVIDTVAQAALLNDENSNSEVQNKIVTPMRRLVRHCDVAVLLLHHEGKGKTLKGENYTQYRARGASALMDGARYQITLMPRDKDKKDPIEVINSKDKGDPFPTVVMSLAKESRWFCVVDDPAASPPTITDVVMDVLDKSGQPLPLVELYTLIPQYQEQVIKNAIAKLVKDGPVIRKGRGLYVSAKIAANSVPQGAP